MKTPLILIAALALALAGCKSNEHAPRQPVPGVDGPTRNTQDPNTRRDAGGGEAQATGEAAMTTTKHEYKHGDVTCEGVLVLPADLKAGTKAPAVMVIHDWAGISAHTETQLKKLAQLGYIAFAADIYGKGVRPTEVKDRAAQAGKYRADTALFRGRIQAGLDALKAMPQVDTTRLAATGYCFGGGAVLELARSGADVRGVVSFHGALKTLAPAKAGEVKAKVLVLHGADDPYVPVDEVNTFIKEMQTAKCDWQMVHYGNAVHSFTHPEAGTDNSKGAAYEERADRRSWEAMKDFLAEALTRVKG